MACTSCSTGKNGMPSGCGNKGHCSTGGCNKLNTFDWLTTLDIEDPTVSHYAEISFKNGARKSFYKLPVSYRFTTGDLVLVDTGSGGYDIGRVSLMGDLVLLQMKRKNYSKDKVMYEVIRQANPRDIEKMEEARAMEEPALVKARVIARTLGLNMKVGDVEYQADLKKATFFYTADGWVDFRELVKQYAREFRVKIEMRQIGARQESARIGGIGACGRELCCSTWLTDFKSVNTTAARYQNIAINQSKLSGQCGRLKCCLNYELDLYIDELDKYPSDVETLKAKNGRASLVKIDIFKGMIYYQYEPLKGRSIVMPLSPDEVRRIKSLNDRGEMPDDIVASQDEKADDAEAEQGYADVTGAIELPADKRRKKKKNKNRQNKNPNQNQAGQTESQQQKPQNKNTHSNQNNPRNNGDQNQDTKSADSNKGNGGQNPSERRPEQNRPKGPQPPQHKNRGDQRHHNRPNREQNPKDPPTDKPVE